jgi:hypothetical protein
LPRRREIVAWFSSLHCRVPGYRLDDEELGMIERFCAEFREALGLDD